MRRVLYVDVCRAKNIVGVNKRAGNSDVYSVACLEGIGGREIKKEKFKTKTIVKTLAPEWNDRFTFGQEYDLNTDGELPTIVVTLYHQAGYLQSDECMGRVAIPLDTVDPAGVTASAWYPLVGDARSKYHASGEV